MKNKRNEEASVRERENEERKKERERREEKRRERERERERERNWASLLSWPRRRAKPAPTQHVDGK